MMVMDSEDVFQKKECKSAMLTGMAVALVVGLVYVGASTNPISSLFTLRSPVQTATSIAPATTVGTGTPISLQRFSSGNTNVKVPSDNLMEEEAEVSNGNQGFGLPLILAGLSMMLLGLASWLVRPQQRMALAFATSTRGTTTLNAADHDAPENPAKLRESMQSMLTPLGYYEAYEVVVLVSPRLTDIEKEDRLASLETLFAANKCKKVEKLDRGRRLLAYPMKGCIEAYIVIYTFKGPRSMPKLINDWFTGPGLNSDGNVFRCFLCKQRRVKKGANTKAPPEDEMPMWTV